MLIDAVFFDLDDTLFPQAVWLAGAWERVAAAAPAGVRRECFHDALVAVAAEGSDRGRIIDRALARVGAASVPVAPLVDAFRTHAPRVLHCYDGAAESVAHLRMSMTVGLVTDGDPRIQRAKLAALGLDGAFDVVVFSDELGRAYRKPDPTPFRRAARGAGVIPTRCVYVGDRPDKDITGARSAGFLGAVRVRQGEYLDVPAPRALANVPDVATAVDWIDAQLLRVGVPSSPLTQG